MRSIIQRSRLSFSFLFPLTLLAGNDPAALHLRIGQMPYAAISMAMPAAAAGPMPWKVADSVTVGTHH